MSYVGYVMNALVNDDVTPEDRRRARRRRQRKEARIQPQQRVVRPTADALRPADAVRPRRAAKLGV